MEVTSETSPIPDQSFPMNGGDGRYSYVHNSSFQRDIGIEIFKGMLMEAIEEKLDIVNLPNANNAFRIVDLGCSIGPNTFIVVQNIIQAIGQKYNKSLRHFDNVVDHISFENKPPPEFHVFFNDHTSNDFNTLFTSLPLQKQQYFAAGVPGSFYTRLFPRGSLHFVHSSCALHWLSRVPKEVVDINSSAWNKGRIHYSNAPIQVLEAYSAQFVKDMETFLHVRAQEIVCGGLMVISIPALHHQTSPSLVFVNILYNLLGSCLIDMAKMEMVDEAKVDYFNLPIYFPSPEEVEALVERNGYFSMERLEAMTPPPCINPQILSDTIRAALEGLIKHHFGSDINMDQLFDLYTKKLAESLPILKSGKGTQLFVLLKRNPRSDYY